MKMNIKVMNFVAITGLSLSVIISAEAKSSKANPNPPLPANTTPVRSTVDVPQMSYEEKKLRTLSDPGISGLAFFPRVSGSTSTIPVGQLLMARALGLPAELRRFATGGEFSSRSVQRSSVVLTFPLDADVERIQQYSLLQGRNSFLQTGPSYDALAKGAVDLILVAREPSAGELKIAGDSNTSFDVRPVALDALVFICNQKNGVSNLTLDQIRDVYTGKVKNWKEIGGNDREIDAITRDRNSGSEELMRKLVMGDRQSVPGRNRDIMSMIGTLDAVEKLENSLGYSVFYYERIMNPRTTIKPLAINGVLPSQATIANRTYPLVEPVYIVTRKGIAETDPAAILRNWLLSSEGQKLIAQSGYVPLAK